MHYSNFTISQLDLSSVWGRIGSSGIKAEVSGKNENAAASSGYLGNEAKEDHVEGLSGGSGSVRQRKWYVPEDVGSKIKISASTSRKLSDPAHVTEKTSHKAQRTLFVNGIPLKSNKKESLLTHFQKFGEVVDIYIPLNSERAFVQFSTREESESSLKAPDVVMGNRFIGLWWANRDSIPENGVGNTPSMAPRGLIGTSGPPQSSGTDSGKENLPSVPVKVSVLSVPDTSVPVAVNAVTISTAPVQSPRTLMPSSHPSVARVSSFSASRFKLYNRPTTFRILPPVPADLENDVLLKEHLPVPEDCFQLFQS